MELGIHGADRDNMDLIRDLGVSWTKIPGNIEPETVPDLNEPFDVAEELGLRCVVDLRTSHGYLSQVSADTQMAMAEAGLLEEVTGPILDLEQHAKQARNLEKVNAVAYAKLYETAARTVEAYQDRCQEWEFWGEAACPWVSGQVFGDKSSTYPVLLESVYKAIKEVDPDCRVWTAGNGMDLQLVFYHACLDHGAGPYFDVCNLHPYFMKLRVRKHADRILEQEYTRLRVALQEQGQDQPFAATEWGYPTYDADSIAVEEYLRSHVLLEGVRQLYWSESEEWFEKDLQAMERHGFEVVVVHSLHDDPAPNPFWGQRCGLIDLQGRKKNVWDVVQRWAWKGREAKQQAL